MAKRNLNGRKSYGTAGIAVIEDPAELEQAVEDTARRKKKQRLPRKSERRKPRLNRRGTSASATFAKRLLS